MNVMIREAKKAQPEKEEEKAKYKAKKAKKATKDAMTEINVGLDSGKYHQGRLCVNRFSPLEAYVGSKSIGEEIIICGRSNMNKAFHGDIVAVELLPHDQCQEEKALSIGEEEGFLYFLHICMKLCQTFLSFTYQIQIQISHIKFNSKLQITLWCIVYLSKALKWLLLLFCVIV
uniref:Exosome complex exonuclease RRP44 n=1 Tax=Noccaea caerulescens TaxID=107243 RepID=A0A1J3EQA8_NOCCA